MGKLAAFSERPNAKSVSASGGFAPLPNLTRGSAPKPRWGLRPQTLIVGASHLNLWGAFNSLAPAHGADSFAPSIFQAMN